MANQTLSAFSKLTYLDGEKAIDKVFKFISAKKTNLNSLSKLGMDFSHHSKWQNTSISLEPSS